MATQVSEPETSSVDMVALAPWASRTTSGTGSLVEILARFRWICFELVVTTAAGGGGATLDVYVQQSCDGVNFDDLAHFAQVLGTSAGEVHICSFPVRQDDAGGEVHAQRDGTLAAGSVAGTMLERKFRAKWVIAGGGTFGFQALAFPRVAV